MNTYYTTRDFEFLRNRPVVLESEALAEIAAVLAQRQPAQSEPVAAQPEMVERMLDAFGAHYDETPKPEALQLARIAMAAAAQACLDEALGPITTKEWNSILLSAHVGASIDNFLAARRARLSALKGER